MKKLCLFLLAASALCAANFSFIIIPDSHIGSPPTFWTNQTQYIASHAAALNIQGVFNTGDIENPGSFWSTGYPGHGMIDIDTAGIRWDGAPGNHDYLYDNTAGIRARDTSAFDAEIYARVNAHSWLSCGVFSYANNNSNHCQLFTAEGRNFGLLVLEYWPPASVMTWATGIITANPNREWIVTTHGYMEDENASPPGKLAPFTSTYGPSAACSGDCDTTHYTSGEDLEAWAIQYPQIRAIFCGHWVTGSHAMRTDTRSGNFPLYGFFTNWQSTGSRNVVLRVEFSSAQINTYFLNTDTGVETATGYGALDWTPPTSSPTSFSGTLTGVIR